MGDGENKMSHPKYSIYWNKKYEDFIRSKTCLVCQRPGVDGHHLEHARKNSFMLIPLCRTHHTFGKDAYHVLEREGFEDRHSVNLDWCVINLLMEYIDEVA